MISDKHEIKLKILETLLTTILGSIISFVLSFLKVISLKEAFLIGGGCLLGVIIVLVFQRVLRNKEKNLKSFCSKRLDKKRYKILIIDDFFRQKKLNAINYFQKHLNEYDTCLLEEISDARLCSEFDIVILDIIGASTMQDNAYGIFKTLKTMYPEKYIIAMSSNYGDLDDLLSKDRCADAIIPKKMNDSNQPDLEQLLKAITDELEKAFSQLDNPYEHWNKTIKHKEIDETIIKIIEERYIKHLKDSGDYYIK